jgi:hypothetical protein
MYLYNARETIPCYCWPQAYRQYATFYTDQYVVYQGVIPAAQHRAINKLACKTRVSKNASSRALLVRMIWAS